jgi:ketosteroid isomerase-like protein
MAAPDAGVPGGRRDRDQEASTGQIVGQEREKAAVPEDLGRMFIERANAVDVDGLVALYEREAVLATPSGQIAIGADAIREVYEKLLATRPKFTSEGQQPALINGDIALTSTLLTGGGATAEIARRQPDGEWLWAVDQPRIVA